MRREGPGWAGGGASARKVVEAYTRVHTLGAACAKVVWRLDIPARQGVAFGFQSRPPAPEYLESFVPNIASAKKNMRKSRAAAIRNRAQRSALRTALKNAGVADASPEVKTLAVQLLDRAARKGLIHKNAAARRKSRLAKPVAAA
jgi:small subunit ribosomal protein S20